MKQCKELDLSTLILTMQVVMIAMLGTFVWEFGEALVRYRELGSSTVTGSRTADSNLRILIHPEARPHFIQFHLLSCAYRGFYTFSRLSADFDRFPGVSRARGGIATVLRYKFASQIRYISLFRHRFNITAQKIAYETRQQR